MKNKISKILLLFLLGIFIYSCSVVKKVPDGKSLLKKNEIVVNDTVVKDERVLSLLSQKTNTSFLGVPLRLTLYNLAKDNPDSLYYAWLNSKPDRRENLAKILSNKQVDRLSQSFFVSGFSNFLKKVGEPPVILNEKKMYSSANKMLSYYTLSQGFFDASIDVTQENVGFKKEKVLYSITSGEQWKLDTITATIQTPKIDSVYQLIQPKSFIKKGNPFKTNTFEKERYRITDYLRNNGAFHFQVSNIEYKFDTINTNKKVNVEVLISDMTIKKENSDSLFTKPFKIYTISEVNIFTRNSFRSDEIYSNDSIFYNDYNLYSNGKLKFKPKAITDAVFIKKGELFSDVNKTLTSRSLGNLKVFNFPNIEYVEDTLNGKSNLIANIYLSPLKSKRFDAAIDFTHSNIQDFGISGNLSVTFRNIFRRAETLQILTRGNIGASREFSNPDDTFFNISEYGGEAKLSFPRIFFPLETNKIIRKEMLPSTQISVSLTKQINIGLDKENFTGIINYNWIPKLGRSFRFDLLNIQFVKNLQVGNYFNVYRSSYNRLNEIAQVYNNDASNADGNNLTFPGAVNFINQVTNGQTALVPTDPNYQSVRSIGERRKRLIENNLIVSSALTYVKNTKANLIDNNFYIFKTKIETAGNLTSLIAKSTNEPLNENGNRTLLNLEYAQFVKLEYDYIKHWPVSRTNVIAIRTFAGIAIPYGNANSIPFSRSYFAGGTNDNRGWQAYALGPGSSGGINDFNEANLKIAASAEFRFPVSGKFKSALFADVGNIWNVFDNVTDPKYTFNNLASLKDLAVGTGIGLRYDFDLFVFRLDLGFKTYNPGRELNDRWLKDITLNKTVLNFGINYPF